MIMSLMEHKSYDGKYNYPDEAIAIFSKEISYSDKDSNQINDNSTKVSMQFEKRADYNKIKKNKNGDDIYIRNPDTFIKGLIEEIKDPKYSI